MPSFSSLTLPRKLFRLSLPTRRSSDLTPRRHTGLRRTSTLKGTVRSANARSLRPGADSQRDGAPFGVVDGCRCCSGSRSEHTSELQSPCNLVCRLLLEKKKL